MAYGRRRSTPSYVLREPRIDFPGQRPDYDPSTDGPPRGWGCYPMTKEQSREYERFLVLTADLVADRYGRWRKHLERTTARWVEPQRKQSRDAWLATREGMLLGARILGLRQGMHWTQKQAAERLGVSRRTVIRHEQGQTVSMYSSMLAAVRRWEAVYAQTLGA
jgi:DNA-binding XRE family transcriptional regulator